ncbi:MAG: deoxyhypusine synthase [Desulfobacterales bacterium]
MKKPKKKDFLKKPVRHADITRFDARPILETMAGMSFSARECARAAEIYRRMLNDPDCTVVLALAGSTSAAGCLQVYADMVRYNLVDVIVATGAAIVDMDFFEALGHRHYQGTAAADDRLLRELYIDRIYDTYIDEEELQVCDLTIQKIADALPPRPYSSREFIREMGRYLTRHAAKKGSLVELAYRHHVPIFCPAFTDSSAGFGLVKHQAERPENHLTIDAVRDFRELTRIKMEAKTTGLFIVGGGVPKNFIQDTVICAEMLGKPVPMHKYAVQVTVADVRDGACSSSTLKEASSWGKVDTTWEQMVYAEATLVVPLIVSDLYHRKEWKKRKRREWAKRF